MRSLFTQIGPGFQAPLLNNQFDVRAGFYTVKTVTQRNNIKLAYRTFDGTSATLVFVADTNRLYKLINEPFTPDTTDVDWEPISLGVEGGLVPVGDWDVVTNTPTLTDVGASGRNGEFYFAKNAGSGYAFTDPDLFEGDVITIFNGDWIISLGDKWFVLRPTVTWDMLVKPASIDAYVAGTVIAHTHAIGDVTGLSSALDLKYDSGDTADETIAFALVPDPALIQLKFLKQWYYTSAEVDALVGSFTTSTFLGLADTPNNYTAQALKTVRVNAAANALEFYDIALDAAAITTGVFDIARIPASALERVYVYAGGATTPETAGLTLANVQNGDVVKMNSTGLMYVVTNDAALSSAGSFEAFNAGVAASVPWSGITSKPTTIAGFGITDALSTANNGLTRSANNVALGGTLLLSTDISGPYDLSFGGAGGANKLTGFTVRTNAGSGFYADYFNAGVVASILTLNSSIASLEWNDTGSTIRKIALQSANINIQGPLLVDGGGGTITASTRLDVRGISSGIALRIANNSNTEIFKILNTSVQTSTTSTSGSSFTGTWTASANSQVNLAFTGSFTARATVSDTLTGYSFTPTLTAAAATQTLYGVDINPTFVPGAFGPTSWALRVNGTMQVVGAAQFSVSPSILGGNSLTLFNSSNTTSVKLQYGATGSGANYTGADAVTFIGTTGAGIGYFSANGLSGASGSSSVWGIANLGTVTSGNVSMLTLGFAFGGPGGSSMAHSSGTGIYRAILINHTLNTTGSFSGGIAYGIDYDPTATSTTGLTHIAFRATSGSVFLANSNATTISASTKLDVRGLGNTSSTFTAKFLNSSGADVMHIQDNGIIRLGILSSFSNATGIVVNTGRDTSIGITFTGSAVYDVVSTNRTSVGIAPVFQWAGGTNVGISLGITPTINNTSGTTTIYGIDYNPTLTAVTGTTHYAIRTASGSILFGNSSSDTISANTRLDIRGTGTTSSTFAVKVINSAGSDLFHILDNGVTRLNSLSSLTTANSIVIQGGRDITYAIQFSTLNNYDGANTVRTNVGITPTFGWTSGANTGTALGIIPVMGLTGGTTTVYGIDYNPTLTTVVGLTHYAMRTTSGTILFASSSSDTLTASTRLDVRGISGGNVIRAASDANAQVFVLDNSANLTIGNGTTTTSMFYTVGGGLKLQSQGIVLNGESPATQAIKGVSTMSTSAGNQSLSFSYGSQTQTSGTNNIYSFSTGTVNPASGNATINALVINQNIGPTGTTSGGTYGTLVLNPVYNFTVGTQTAYGVDYNPTLTSVTGLTNIAIRTTSGQILFATSSSDTVTASTRVDIRGIDTAANPALRIANSSNLQLLNMRNDGVLILGQNGLFQFQRSNDGVSVNNNGNGIVLNGIVDSQPTAVPMVNVYSSATARTTGTAIIFGAMGAQFNPSSGTANFTSILVQPTYNTTGTYAGTAIGIDYNPALTSTIGLVHIAIRTASGQVLYASSSSDTITANTRLDVRGLSGGNTFRLANSSNTVRFIIQDDGYIAHTPAAATGVGGALYAMSVSFVQSSGTTTQTMLQLVPNYNTTSSYVGIVYGIDYNPTLTNVVGLTNIAIRATSGNVVFGHTSASSRLHIRGTGTTSSTSTQRWEDSSGSLMMEFLDDGALRFGNTGARPNIFPSNGDATISKSGASLSFVSSASNVASIFMANTGTGYTNVLTLGGSLVASSGTGTSRVLAFNHVINTTGTFAGGILYGIDYNPTETSLTGLTHYGIVIRSVSAKNGFGTGTPLAIVDILQNTLGNLVFQYASVATNDDPTVSIYQNRVATTDATVTTLHTVVIPASTTVLISGYVVSRRTGGAAGTAEDGAAYKIEAVYKNVAGTATVIGAPIITVIGESQAGWDVTLVPSAGNILIKVTGAVSNNVTWHLSDLCVMPVGT
jgi:hypothetical protein